MRFSPFLVILAALGLSACGPTYVVQSTPHPAPQRVPVPPRVQPLEVNIVRPEDGRVLIQTSRPAYVAVFEIIPGRGVSLVYPAPYRPRDVMLTGLTWVNIDWTMRADYDRRFASNDTRYIYAVASDTPLQISDQDYNREHLQRELGGAYWSSSPNATVRAISREFVRAEPDEWWGEDMYSMPLTSPRMTVTIRLARVYCPGGVYFDVRDDVADHLWCPGRVVRVGERPIVVQPDSVFGSNGRRLPRRVDPSARTPIYRVPAGTQVGEQQGQPTPPRNPVPFPRRGEPSTPQMPAANQPPQNQPPENQPPQGSPPRTQPPQTQPPQTQPPQNQPPQTQPQDPNGGNRGHDDNGRRAHGDPRNADPRGNGNGYGNGGREQPSTQPPATTPPASTPASNPPQSNPQPQQQGQSHGAPTSTPGNSGQSHGNSNPGNSGNAGNNGNGSNASGNGKGPDKSGPDHNEAPKGIGAILRSRAPQGLQKQQDDKNKKAANDSTTKKKP